MKLLGWMHRKLRQDSSDRVFGDFTAGSGCNCLSSYQPVDNSLQFNPLVPAEFMLEGLLAIGTLGITSEPTEELIPVPHQLEEECVAMDVEAIAEKEESEVATEADLMIINTELEKVLLAEADKESDGFSSARPSHVAKASTECPLQDYLFGAKVEATVEKKEKRASLGELFMIQEGVAKDEGTQGSGAVDGGGSEKVKNGTKVQVMMKRMLMRCKSTSRKSATIDGDADTANKFHKILRVFHRKIHPENNIALKKSAKPTSKHRNKGSAGVPYIGHCFCGSAENIPDTTSECTRDFVSSSKPCQDPPPSILLSKSDSMGSREYWIKTDVDYLVLEL